MTLDAGPMCPYCFKRGVHLATCIVFHPACLRRGFHLPTCSSLSYYPKDKS